MKKVLVPTDFSWNSKAGIRFAIQWAYQQKIELVFTHVIIVNQPARWNEGNFALYLQNETKNLIGKMRRFVEEIYESMKRTPGKHSYIILHGADVDLAIMDFCQQRKDIHTICISTHGATGFRKVLGTNTGNLISKSGTPVLAIPKSYKPHRITKVLFATDMRHFNSELRKVLSFAKPLDAKIEILHLSWLDELLPGQKMLSEMLRAQYDYKIKVDFVIRDISKSWNRNMLEQINDRHPSVVVMFTDQTRSPVQKLLGGSKAEQLSFWFKVPLLVYPKSFKEKKQNQAVISTLSGAAL